jgi:hypothetical protein
MLRRLIERYQDSSRNHRGTAGPHAAMDGHVLACIQRMNEFIDELLNCGWLGRNTAISDGKST